MRGRLSFANVRRLTNPLLIISVCMMMFAIFYEGQLHIILLLAGFIVSLIGLVLLVKYWRSPNCGEHLPLRESHPDYCSSCGEKLIY